jgi:3-methyladenine DNA glycosylase AlkC
MADALKDMFSAKFYKRLAEEFKNTDKNFNDEGFYNDVVAGLEELSLNQRMRNTSVVLKKYLPVDYSKALNSILAVAPKFRSSYTALLFPDFVGQFGHDNKQLSLDALKTLTTYGSSEFAIREFLKRDLKGTLKVMYKWADDSDQHVRRLASEGSRPRLPWSFNIPEIMNDPALTLPILEKLKADPELYVRKSVANHLNDFSRTKPDWLLKVVNSWDKTNENTKWIIKHACRTLIKKGDAETLAVFEFEKNAKVKIENFKLTHPKIKLGQTQQFSFDIISEKKKPQKLVIDYAVHYPKGSGSVSRKVFKLKEVVLEPAKNLSISKAQAFKDFTTRTHYSGKHSIEIIINGKIYGTKDFTLLKE